MTILNNKFKGFVKFLIKILLLTALGFIIFLAGEYTYNNYKENIVLEKKVQELENLREKERLQNIENLKSEILNNLYSEEFGSNWKKRRASGENLETFDPNNRNHRKCSTRGGVMRYDCISIGVGQLQLERAIIFQNKLIKAGIYSKESKLTPVSLKSRLLGDPKFYDKFIMDAIVNIPSSIYKWSSAVDDRSYYNSKVSELRKLLKK